MKNLQGRRGTPGRYLSRYSRLRPFARAWTGRHILLVPFFLAVLSLMLLFATTDSLAQTAEPGKGYEAFRLVRTRNVFDPNRQAARPEGPRVSAPAPERARSNYLSLTGTLVTAEKSVAFFGGSGADSSKVGRVGDMVAEHKLKAIGPNEVELEKAGKTTRLTVGKQLALDGSGHVSANASAEAAAPAPNPPAAGNPPPTTSSAPPSSSSSNSNPSDVLRRMMERRQQESSPK